MLATQVHSLGREHFNDLTPYLPHIGVNNSEKNENDVVRSDNDDDFISVSLNEADFGWNKNQSTLNK